MKTKLLKHIFLFTLSSFMLQGCVGVDYIDDTDLIVMEDFSRIKIEPANLALFLGETASIEAKYYNKSDELEEVQFDYISNNTAVATVNDQGIVTAVADGQTSIRVSYQMLAEEVLVTVVSDSNAVARIELIVTKSALSIGDQLQFQSQVYNFAGDDITDNQTVSWLSSDESVAEIDNNGLLTATMDGVTNVWAEVGSIRSGSCEVEVGEMTRSGSFNSLNGYTVNGNVTVSKIGENTININLAANFMADNGPGLYVYLSNQESNVNGGVEVSKLNANSGEQNYSINVDLYDYEYVIIQCKPFNISFGSAKLN